MPSHGLPTSTAACGCVIQSCQRTRLGSCMAAKTPWYELTNLEVSLFGSRWPLTPYRFAYFAARRRVARCTKWSRRTIGRFVHTRRIGCR